MKHNPDSHCSACHCRQPATVHVAYGSGCGNVCDEHAAAVRAAKGSLYAEGNLILVVPVDITGPTGRGYLMLPCKHQRAALADPYHAQTPASRTCQVCGARYQIEVTIRPAGTRHEAAAQITRKN